MSGIKAEHGKVGEIVMPTYGSTQAIKKFLGRVGRKRLSENRKSALMEIDGIKEYMTANGFAK